MVYISFCQFTAARADCVPENANLLNFRNILNENIFAMEQFNSSLLFMVFLLTFFGEFQWVQGGENRRLPVN